MSSDGFLPASAATAKSKKLARQAASRPTTSSTTAAVKAKGKGKASARGAESHLLSTQPGQADDDFMDDEFEREPLDAGVEPKRALGGAAAAGDADAAMDEDGAGADDEDDAVMIDPSQLPTPVVRTPIAQLEASAAASSSSDPNSLSFAPVKNHGQAGLTQKRKIGIPPHRMTPLKRDWIKIYTPLVEECGLQVRMNVHKRQVEMKVRSLFTGVVAGARG